MPKIENVNLKQSQGFQIKGLTLQGGKLIIQTSQNLIVMNLETLKIEKMLNLGHLLTLTKIDESHISLVIEHKEQYAVLIIDTEEYILKGSCLFKEEIAKIWYNNIGKR